MGRRLSPRDVVPPGRYRWFMTIVLPSGVSQDHWGEYPVPAGSRLNVRQITDEVRKSCAKQMGVGHNLVRVGRFDLTSE